MFPIKKIPKAYAVLICTFAGCIVFFLALQRRSLDDFFRYLPWIAFCYSIALLAVLVEHDRRPTALTTIAKIRSVLPLFVLAILGVSVFTYSIGVLGIDFVNAANQAKDAKKIAVLAVIAGIFLWFFRLHCRSTYGLIEALMGGYFAWHTVGANIWKSESDMYLAVLTAGVYLIVRGLDNIEQGLEKDKLVTYLKSLKQGTFNKQEDKIAVEKYDRSKRAEEDKIAEEHFVQSIQSPAERYIDKDSLSPENLSRFPQLVERIREIELKRKSNS